MTLNKMMNYLFLASLIFSFTKIESSNLGDQVTIDNALQERIDSQFNHNLAFCEIGPRNINFFPTKNSKDSLYYLFEIGSITKLFTAHLALIFEKEGKIDLDIPIENYLQNCGQIPTHCGKKITCRHLLLFCSGLTDPAPACEYGGKSKPLSDYTKKDLYSFLQNFELSAKPGSCLSEYSNIEFGILGHILEIVAHSNLEDLFCEKIFRPLGLKHTFYNVPEQLQTLRVQGYSCGIPTKPWQILTLKGFSGLISCANDLSLYFQSIFFREKGGGEIAKALLAPVVKTVKPELSYSCGMGIMDDGHKKIWVSSGFCPGFSCCAAYDPDQERAHLLLSDSDSLDGICYESLKNGFKLLKLPRLFKVKTEALKRFSGLYRGKIDSEEITCSIDVDDEGLVFKAANEKPVQLLACSSENFYCPSFFHQSFRASFSKDNRNVKQLLIQERDYSLLLTKIA